MNIGIYLKHFPPIGGPIIGGTAKAVQGIAAGLAANGEKVTILCEGKIRSSTIMENGYKIECFINPKYRTFTISDDLKNFVHDNFMSKDSLVIVNGIFNPSVYGVARFLKSNNIPYVLAPHDPYHPAIFKKNRHLKLPYWFLFERKVLNEASSVQVLDTRHAEWLEKLGIKTPVIAAPNGFSPEEVNSEFGLKWRDSTLPSILYLGRMDTYNKGLDILIDAFAEVIKVHDAKLTLQGSGHIDRETLEEKVKKLSLGNRVFFHDADFSKTASSLIAKHDIFCLPSRFEGFGLSAIEAMLAGRVLLVSDVAGIAPCVMESKCGVVVKPIVSEVTAGLLELLRRRPQWKEMGLNGRAYALENLRWDAIASSVLKEYQKLVA